jgi:hypothetical protein
MRSGSANRWQSTFSATACWNRSARASWNPGAQTEEISTSRSLRTRDIDQREKVESIGYAPVERHARVTNIGRGQQATCHLSRAIETIKILPQTPHRMSKPINVEVGFSPIEVLAALLATMPPVLTLRPFVIQMPATSSRGGEVARCYTSSTMPISLRIKPDISSGSPS